MVKSISLDDKDYSIIASLKENGRLSSQQVATKTRLPISTVHNRVKKMELSGAIKGYTVLLDERKTGTILAYVLIVVNYHPADGSLINQHELAKKIRQISGVEEVSMTTGSTDIVVKFRAKGVDDLDQLVTKQLRSFKGVDKTQTLVVLNSM